MFEFRVYVSARGGSPNVFVRKPQEVLHKFEGRTWGNVIVSEYVAFH